MRRAALVWLLAVTGCRGCHRSTVTTTADRDEATEEGDDPAEEAEERGDRQPNYWRAEIAIVGQGRVATRAPGFDCRGDGERVTGACGPTLLAFSEREPPLLRATGAPGWRFDHWASRIRERDGRTAPRSGPMPDGRLYLNGFGYTDTGALETVTAIFVRDREHDDASADALAPP